MQMEKYTRKKALWLLVTPSVSFAENNDDYSVFNPPVTIYVNDSWQKYGRVHIIARHKAIQLF